MAAGLRDIVPVLAGVAPFGMAIGVTVAESPVDNVAGWAGAPLLFAGSAHLALISLLGAGASWLTAVATALAINARFLIYSASLSRSWERQPRWFRWVAPYFLVDQLFALLGARDGEGRDDAWIRGYYLAAAIALWATWLIVVALGAAVGPVLPARWALAFASPALLTALVVPALRGRPALAAGVVATAATVVARPWLGGGALLVGAAAGMLAGWAAEGRAR